MTSRTRPDYENMPGFLKDLNWDNKNINNKVYPIRVKQNSNIATNVDWKEHNLELLEYKNNKKRSENKKFDPKEFKQKFLMSSLTQVEENMRKSQSQRNFNKLGKTNSITAKADPTNKSTASGKELNGNTHRMKPVRSNPSEKIENTKDQYKIRLNKDTSVNDIKKILLKDGIHIYNVKENSKWANGNDQSDITFKVRRQNDSESRIPVESLVLKGMKLEKCNSGQNIKK